LVVDVGGSGLEGGRRDPVKPRNKGREKFVQEGASVYWGERAKPCGGHRSV